MWLIVATIVPNCDYNMDMSMGLYININHCYPFLWGDLVLMTDISGHNCRQTILQSMVYMLVSKQLQKALFVAKSVVSEFPIKLVQWNRKSQVKTILVQVWPKFNVAPFSHSFICASGSPSSGRSTEPLKIGLVTSPGDFTGEVSPVFSIFHGEFSHTMFLIYLIQSHCEAVGQTISSSCCPHSFLK